MPLLKTDDDARNIPSVWLGPPDVVRWPFDASFTQWVMGFALLLPCWATYALFVPVFVWAGLFGYFFPKFFSQRFPEKFPKLLRSPIGYRVLIGLLLVLVYFGNLKGFFLPMNPFAAVPFAIVSAFLIVRKVSRYITPMTPVRYWIGVLIELLRRPRTPTRAAQEFSLESHVVAEFDDGFDLGELDNPRPKLSLRKEL